MHTYTAKDVLDDSFDLKLLRIPEAELNKIRITFSRIRTSIEAQKRASNTKSSYVWVGDDEALNADGGVTITPAHYLSMVFNQDDLAAISTIISGSNRYTSWQLLSKINLWVTSNSSLAKKILFNSSTNDSIKANIVNRHLIQTSDLLEFSRSDAALQLPQFLQDRILEISSPEDAKIFLRSDWDKIKLSAYKKLGPISYLDEMIKDPHAIIRSYAINLLSPGDARLSSFINDRSHNIFCEALSKISPELIPMMLGSTHLKKKRAKEILNNRLNNA